MSRQQIYISEQEIDRVVLAQTGGRNRGFNSLPFPADNAVELLDDEVEDGFDDDGDAHDPDVCDLCTRAGLELTRHHLIPRSRHRKARSKRQFTREEMRTRIAYLCRDCHGQIHRLFTEKQLAAEYNTLETLKSHEGVQKFIGYIRKKH